MYEYQTNRYNKFTEIDLTISFRRKNLNFLFYHVKYTRKQKIIDNENYTRVSSG